MAEINYNLTGGEVLVLALRKGITLRNNAHVPPQSLVGSAGADGELYLSLVHTEDGEAVVSPFESWAVKDYGRTFVI